MAASDPGINDVHTIYGTNNTYITVGKDYKETMIPMFKRLDLMDSDIDKLTGVYKKRKKKVKLKRMRKKLLEDIHNKQMELHHKLANFLTKNYSGILMPQLNTRWMSSEESTLTESTIRLMMSIGHGKFLNILKNKCKSRGIPLVIVPEAFTSQICGFCTEKTKTKNKIFQCNHCGKTIDRDINASRNIFIGSIVQMTF